MGGLLVTLAALGTFVAYTSASSGPTSTVVVAHRSLVAGEIIRADDLRAEPADLPGAVRDTLFTTPADLEGAVALAPIDGDQAIPRSAVRVGGADTTPTRELSFALERDRALNGRIRPGERVDLVATYGTGDDATTEVVARSVRVIDLGAPSGGGATTSAKVTITVALEDEATVLRAANALEVAEVTLIRTTGIAAGDDRADPVSTSDRSTASGSGDAGGSP